MNTLSIFITFLLLTIVATHPTIGILTIPSDDDYTQYPKQEYSYLAASYVKFIESAGAQVIPIPYEAEEEELDKYFNAVNGILFTGGTLELEDDDGPTKYTQTVTYLLEKTLIANDNGDYFPIMGTCLGHQTLHYIISGYKANVLEPLDGLNRVNQKIEIWKSDAQFYINMDDQLQQASQQQNIVYFFSHGGVLPGFYKTNFQLQQFFDITAVSYDKSGNQFIASTQSKHYPIYTTQYHAEKSQFEWNVPANHNKISILFGRQHANEFVNQCRKNTHELAESIKKQVLIYNHDPIVLEGASFNQIYFFKNGELHL